MNRYSYPLWTKEKEDKMIDELQEYDLDTIAKMHNRTKTAITKRLDRVLLQKLSSGYTDNKELALVFNMTEEGMEKKCNRLLNDKKNNKEDIIIKKSSNKKDITLVTLDNKLNKIMNMLEELKKN